MSNINPNAKIYAILADSVYWDVRESNYEKTKDYSQSNWTPIPSDWKVLTKYDVSGSGSNVEYKDNRGFSARVFQKIGSNEVVIAYAGTQDGIDWVSGNLNATLGVATRHLTKASELYEKVRNELPAGTKISFTGHSLGGGIANVMGVWFNKPAYGFDPAPFKQSVINEGSFNTPSDKVQDLVAVINSIARATKSIPLINLTIGGLAVGANLIFAYNVLMDSAIKDAQDNLKQKLQNKEFQSLDENFL